MKKKPSYLVAIVGGSGSGKTWLADQLQDTLGQKAGRICLDDFYLDRSHLPPGRRARLNFDHPRAIDWAAVENALQACRAGKAAKIPQYDFKTHSRRKKSHILKPKEVFLVDGLWLLHRPRIRRLFDLKIFVACPAKTRLKRRLARDLLLRGRSPESVRRQFMETVEPMNARYVAPQSRLVRHVLRSPVKNADMRRLAKVITIEAEKLSKS